MIEVETEGSIFQACQMSDNQKIMRKKRGGKKANDNNNKKKQVESKN